MVRRALRVKKKRDFNDREELRGIIRRQAKEIKELKKQLGRLNKTTNRLVTEDLNFHTEIEPTLEVEDKNTKRAKCLKCGKPVVEIDMGIKQVHMCKHCGHKRVL
jgi:formylmethanofuran dehydrogenase subunit E